MRCPVACRNVDALLDHELVRLVNFGDYRLGVLEEKHQLNEAYSVMGDHLVHLAFLWPDFDLLLLIIGEVSIFALLERLGHIGDALDLDQEWLAQVGSLVERDVK